MLDGSSARGAAFTARSSLDGYGAGPLQTREDPLGVGGEALHEWLIPTRAFQRINGRTGGSTGPVDDIAARSGEGIGAWIMGRNMFGPIRGPWPDDAWRGWWGKNSPYHGPVFVLTQGRRRQPVGLHVWRGVGRSLRSRSSDALAAEPHVDRTTEMTRPTHAETDAAAAILARDWDADGRIAGGLATSYAEWGFGIADMIGNEAPVDAVVEYLGVLEERLGVERSPLGRRVALAERLSAAVREGAGQEAVSEALTP